MKKTITLLVLASALSSVHAATSISLRNFFGPTEGLPLVDNAGAVIALADLTFQAGTVSAENLATIRTLNPDSDDAQVRGFFQGSGTPRGANFAGLFNAASSDVDDGGALGTATTPLFILVSRASTGDVMLFETGKAFPVQVAGNAADNLEVRDASAVVFGGGVVSVTDDSLLPAALQGNFPQGLAFNADVIPEPSTSLLAGLAGLALLARRRR